MRRRSFWEPGPIALDPASGFRVPHHELVKQWDGEMVSRRFADAQRHPSDTYKPPREQMVLRNARPEPEDRSVALPILWEDGRVIVEQGGEAILGAGGALVL